MAEKNRTVNRKQIFPYENKYIKVIISLAVSVIDIYLAVSLAVWTKSADWAAVMAYMLFGAAVCFILIYSFLSMQERRLRVHSLLWGVFMAAAYVLGCLMRRDGTALRGIRELPGLIASIGAVSVFAASCVAQILSGFPLLCKKKSVTSCVCAGSRAGGHRRWALYTILIFLCWLPVFLAYYPSVFAYDAEGQLYQVIAHDYSTHHPLLHTLFLGAFFRLGGSVLGSYSAGMAVHSLVQMTLMAVCFGYVLSYLYEKGVSVYLRLGMLLFYALFPANSVLAISTTKDVLFSALTLLYTIIIYRMADRREHFGKRDWCMYIFVSVLLLLFRNNALYAYVPGIPVLWAGLRTGRDGRKEKAGRGIGSAGDEKKRERKVCQQYLAASAAALVLFGLSTMALKAVTGAHNGSPREMLSIPLQQMARTRVEAEESLTPEMRRELDRYLSSDWVFAAYNPYLADPVKSRAVIHDDPAGLIRTWIKLGLEHPQIYIDAFLDNSIGYWFVEDRTHAQIYGIGTESGFGYLSTDNRTMPAGCEIVEQSVLPGLRRGMERIVSDNVYQKWPVIRIIFAPAFYWWMLCMYMAAALYERRYLCLLPAVFPVVYYMTLLLSPTVLIRYMYPFVVTVPAICCCLKAEGRSAAGENSSNVCDDLPGDESKYK